MRKFLKFMSIACCMTVCLMLTSCSGKRPSTAELAYTSKVPVNANSASHIAMRLHSKDGGALYLCIPTFWDDVHKEWSGAVQTPITKTLLCASGKDSYDLENNFYNIMSNAMADPSISAEVLNMFHPLEE